MVTFVQTRTEYPALIPGWLPKQKAKPKQGDGRARRFFADGSNKKGWAPVVNRFGMV
jgi:hypothetical protein